jgi:hypothetical protein
VNFMDGCPLSSTSYVRSVEVWADSAYRAAETEAKRVMAFPGTEIHRAR